MTISKDLFLAILAMDSYNRGIGHGTMAVTNAKPKQESPAQPNCE